MKRLDRIEKWLENSLLSKLCEKLVEWLVWDEDVPENEETGTHENKNSVLVLGRGENREPTVNITPNLEAINKDGNPKNQAHKN